MTVKFVLVNNESVEYTEATKVDIDDHGTSHNIVFEVVKDVSPTSAIDEIIEILLTPGSWQIYENGTFILYF